MKVLEFRKITINDRFDSRYGDYGYPYGFPWSRPYEYPLVIDTIKKYFTNNDLSLHNTSWGFTGVHILFKEDLDVLFTNVLHSDILPSNLKNTTLYDITKNPDSSWIGKFDVVVNVSTLEEVNYDHVAVFNNLLSQVKPGGFLICTFDLPGLQVNLFEELFGKSLDYNEYSLNGINSKVVNNYYASLECGIMVVQKDEE